MKKGIFKQWVAGAVSLLAVVFARGELVVHLSAQEAAYVQADGENVVTHWLDQSGAGNHAVADQGRVLHVPGKTLNAAGKPGLAFRESSLVLLSASAKEAVLDFSGAARDHTGFAAVIAFEVDELQNEWCDLMGTVTKFSASDGFLVRFGLGHLPFCAIGGQRTKPPRAGVPVDTPIVIAMNYDVSTGLLMMWNSLNDGVESVPVPAGDFSNDLPLRIGGTTGTSSRSLIGLIGEVRLYNHSLSTSEFDAVKSEVTEAWGVAVAPPGLIASTQRSGSTANSSDDAVDYSFSTRYEAEKADHFVGDEGLEPSASGGADVKYDKKNGYIEWSIVSDGGLNQLAIGIRSPIGLRKADLLVNGSLVGTVEGKDPTWGEWISESILLNEGLNSIRMQPVEGSGALHIDYLEIKNPRVTSLPTMGLLTW